MYSAILAVGDIETRSEYIIFLLILLFQAEQVSAISKFHYVHPNLAFSL